MIINKPINNAGINSQRFFYIMIIIHLFNIRVSGQVQTSMYNDAKPNAGRLEKVSHGHGGPSDSALCVIGYGHNPVMTISPDGNKIVYTEIIGMYDEEKNTILPPEGSTTVLVPASVWIADPDGSNPVCVMKGTTEIGKWTPVGQKQMGVAACWV